ncbi:hypothetical protein [uncultured Desulfovibrio sp.]|uniref:hypothetical protein n=1 Tax=uncultured Desulfovibrio sp. TaxID=167968 RepID=UPI00262709C4|nr:hypothetical protein [uncultured Desulfovibrio sp.]
MPPFEHFACEKVKRKAATLRRLVQNKRENRVLSAKRQPYGSQRDAFQTENARLFPCDGFSASALGAACRVPFSQEKTAPKGGRVAERTACGLNGAGW